MFQLSHKEKEHLIALIREDIELKGESTFTLIFDVVYGRKFIAVYTENEAGVRLYRGHYNPFEDTIYRNMSGDSQKSRASKSVLVKKAGIR